MTAGLLLLTISAVTSVVVGVSRDGVGLEDRMDGDRAVRRAAERLRSLPYCAAAYPQAASNGSPSDLVAAVFPHADVSKNTASARYVAVATGTGEQAGSFVTYLSDDGVEVTCVARFVVGADASELGPEDLGGWDASAATAPPSGTLSILLSVPGAGPGASLVRSALSSAPIAVPIPAAT